MGGETTAAAENYHSYLLGETTDAVYRYHLFNKVHEPATRDRLANLDIAPDAQVLEIGCGIGETACLFAAEIVPDGHVVAFDQAADFVDYARRHAADRGIGNVTFVCASAQDFDFGSKRFDLAHTRFVLSYMPDATDIVGRIFGAMKPGGIFFGEEIVQSYVMDGDTAWYEPFADWFSRLIEAGGGNPKYGLRQLPSDMFAAGFVDLQATGHWPLKFQSTIAEMMRLTVSNEMKSHLVKLGIATEDEIDAALSELEAPDRDFVISPAMVGQMIGRRP